MRDRFRFRMRAREVSRIEAFSDVVFGFALTLIVVSLEVPRTFDDLMELMRGFPAFAICFATLVWIWHEHHKFFRRYDMRDEITIALNAVLLFLVLFYTYPLKFIFAVVTGAIEGSGNAAKLFLIYSGGFVGVFLLLLVMTAHAYRKRSELRLNEFERHDTVTTMMLYTSYCAIGLLSCLLAATLNGRQVEWAGLIYFFLGPVSGMIGYRRGVARDALQSRHVKAASEAPQSSGAPAVPGIAAGGSAPGLEVAIDSPANP